MGRNSRVWTLWRSIAGGKKPANRNAWRTKVESPDWRFEKLSVCTMLRCTHIDGLRVVQNINTLQKHGGYSPSPLQQTSQEAHRLERNVRTHSGTVIVISEAIKFMQRNTRLPVIRAYTPRSQGVGRLDCQNAAWPPDLLAVRLL